MTREEASEILTKCFCDIILPRCDGKIFVRLSLEQAIITAIEALKEEPRKTARWIPLKDGYFFKRRPHKCSACGNILEFEGVNAGRGDANYCPNCGAYMETDE